MRDNLVHNRKQSIVSCKLEVNGGHNVEMREGSSANNNNKDREEEMQESGVDNPGYAD